MAPAASKNPVTFNQSRIAAGLIGVVTVFLAFTVTLPNHQNWRSPVLIGGLLLGVGGSFMYARWFNAKRPTPMAHGVAAGLGLIGLVLIQMAQPIVQVAALSILAGLLIAAAILLKDPGRREQPPRPDG